MNKGVQHRPDLYRERTEIEIRLDEIDRDPVFHGSWSDGMGKGEWRFSRQSQAARQRRHELHEEYYALIVERRGLK